MTFWSDQRTRAQIALVLSGCALFVLSGCSSLPDAQTTRDSLSEVTSSPEATAEEPTILDLLDQIEIELLECTPYLVVTVRGTGEPKNGQLLSPVARTIEESQPDDVEVWDLDYPASTNVKQGATEGLYTLVETLNQQAAECPLQQVVLLGYSQGALVIGDALSDPSVRIVGTQVGELSAKASANIATIVLYGDPRFVGSEDFNRGFFNPDINGLLARPAGALEPYATRIRDFCVRRDFICQSTMSLDEQGHVEYFDNGMQEEGAAFVLAVLSAAEGSDREALEQE